MTDKSVLHDVLGSFDARPQANVRGKVREVTGLVVRATIPRAAVGDLVTIQTRQGPRTAEIVGFRDQLAVLMPFGGTDGIGASDTVDNSAEPLRIECGAGLIGRVLDGLGVPIDGLGPIAGELEKTSVLRAAPNPLHRPRIEEVMSVGVRAIDGLLTLGRGQRIGLFAGSGVGKSVLMGQIAKGGEADVNVICLIGERGREVRDFLEGVLGPEGLKKSVVVCATSDAPSLVRLKSAFVATTIAEYFREQGRDVMLMLDSVTRFARAQREVGLAAGESPARRGYPPSVFQLLPKLLERAGTSERGSITAFYTVLVAGGDMEEPIADEIRGIVDGHIILSRKLAERGHWPAIDVLPSLSRVMNDIATPEHLLSSRDFRKALAVYESRRDLISLGAYEYGTDPEVDFAIDIHPEMELLLQQSMDDFTSFDDTLRLLEDVVG